MKKLLLTIAVISFSFIVSCKKDSDNQDSGASSSWAPVQMNGLPTGGAVLGVCSRKNTLYSLVSTTSDVSVYSSADNGSNWTLLGVWLNNGVLGDGDIEIYATANHLIIYDGQYSYINDITCSQSWDSFVPSDNLNNITASFINNIFANNTDLFVPYISTNGRQGVFWSTDDGASFYDIGSYNLSPFPSSGSFNFVTVSSVGSYMFGPGVYRKTDSGPNWVRIDQGLPASIYLSAGFVSSNGLYTAQNNTVYKSTDNGYNWTVYGSYPPDVPNTKFWLYNWKGKLLWFDRSGIYSTSDGASWTSFTAGINTSSESFSTRILGAPYCETNSFVFTSTNSKIYRLTK